MKYLLFLMTCLFLQTGHAQQIKLLETFEVKSGEETTVLVDTTIRGFVLESSECAQIQALTFHIDDGTLFTINDIALEPGEPVRVDFDRFGIPVSTIVIKGECNGASVSLHAILLN